MSGWSRDANGQPVYNSITYATPFPEPIRITREIHVWKYCQRALVRGSLNLKDKTVALDGMGLKEGVDFHWEGERIVFKKLLLPERLSWWSRLMGHTQRDTLPVTYYLLVIGH
jgi:hypothetical protein